MDTGSSEKSIRPISVDYPWQVRKGCPMVRCEKNTKEHDETNHTTIEIDIQHAYELLDYHKDELFILIDDPSKNKPKIEHIVNLPDDSYLPSSMDTVEWMAFAMDEK